MNLKINFILSLYLVLGIHLVMAQEGLPIYSDYLTDNYYLIHPSMAGAANCSQVRVTGRKNWLGSKNSPGLFTAAYNGRFSDYSSSAIGANFFNDKNGFSSQLGGYVTYAHHLMFSRDEVDLNMLSFGLSAGMIQYRLDQSSFVGVDSNDPLVSSGSVSSGQFNVDVGFSYHLYNTYAHVTMKNLLNNSRGDNELNQLNDLRNLLVSAGHVFQRNGRSWSLEPSVLFSHRFGVNQSLMDFNLKGYYDVDFGKVWGGLSYRMDLGKSDFIDGDQLRSQNLSFFTPFVGVNVGKFMFAYTYSYQSNPVVFNTGGFHQITLGIDFSCRPKRYACYCPSVK